MDDRTLQQKIADQRREFEAERDGMWREMKLLQDQLAQASRINAALTVLHGTQVKDERWVLEVERRRVEAYPWDELELKVGFSGDKFVLDLRRRGERAPFGEVDLPKRGI